MIYLYNNITSIITTYQIGRNRFQKIKINYTYGTYNLDRLKGSDNSIIVETTPVSLMTGFSIFTLDDSNNIIYTLGNIVIDRSLQTYEVTNVPDYDTDKPADYPDNLLSNYRSYRTLMITGWTVTV